VQCLQKGGKREKINEIKINTGRIPESGAGTEISMYTYTLRGATLTTKPDARHIISRMKKIDSIANMTAHSVWLLAVRR
jgi:hypothetical protein